MKKVLVAVCFVGFAAVAASAQGWGLAGDVNRFGKEYTESKAQAKVTTQKVNAVVAAADRANFKAKLKAWKEAAAKKAAAQAAETAEDSSSATTAQAAPAAKPAAKPAEAKKKKGFWNVIVSGIPMDGHCSTQPFK